jgi:pimeloyl-ACP methyl ester carboxylesterase
MSTALDLYREAGPRNAPSLLLLHGFPSSSRMYEPVLARLADAFHLIAANSPSTRRPTPSLT